MDIYASNKHNYKFITNVTIAITVIKNITVYITIIVSQILLYSNYNYHKYYYITITVITNNPVLQLQ